MQTYRMIVQSYQTGENHAVDVPAADQYAAFDAARRAFGEVISMPQLVDVDSWDVDLDGENSSEYIPYPDSLDFS